VIVVMVIAAALLGWFIIRWRARRRSWWERADGLVRESRAVIDLGSTGPVAADPEHQVAHWSTLEQRTQSLIAGVDAALRDAPTDEARAALANVSTAAQAYLAVVQTTRALHLGPPAASAEQLEFAAAEANQRIAELGSATDRLDQIVRPEVAT
jgi:hypothetical protein